MIKKNKKETSKRLKHSYDEIILKPKSSFMINQYFIKQQRFSKSYKVSMYHNPIEDYNIFKQDPLRYKKPKIRQEYKLISTKHQERVPQKTEDELKNEKKYIKKKILYPIEKENVNLTNFKLDEVEKAIFRCYF